MLTNDAAMNAKKKPLKTAVLLAGSVIMAASLILLAMQYYQKALSDSVHNVSQTYLEEISHHEVAHLENDLEAQFTDLRVIVSMLGDISGNSIQELQSHLERMKTGYGLHFLSLIDQDAYYCSSNEYKPAASKINSLSKLINGSDRLISFNESISGDDVILLGLPIETLSFGGKRFVAIVAGIETDDFVKKMALKGTRSQTRTSITDQDGMFIVYTSPDDGEQMGTNLFSVLERYSHMEEGFTLEELRSDMSAGEEGMSFYDLNGSKTMMYYAPVVDTGWYVVSEMPYSLISATVENFMTLTLVADTLIVLIVCGLLTVFLLSLYRTREEMRRSKHMGIELKQTDHAKQQAEKALFKLAYYDELTGIANKNLFLKSAYELLALSRQYAYVVLDIQKFKVINDLFGFYNGDLLLKHMAAVLEGDAGPSEVCARFASDEFHMLLRYSDRPALETRLRAVAAKLCDFSLSVNSHFPIGISIGVYVLEHSSDSVEKMGDFARLALQKIKNFHGSSIFFYNEEMRSSIMEEQEIEIDMQRGIDSEEFLVYLQPKYEAMTQRMVGAEALVRWRHPTQGLLSPDSFIPVFEKNGFISQLDFYMLEAVCKLQHRWMSQGRTVFPISINQSRLLLYGEDYIRQLTGILEAHEIPSNLIELEVTESVFLEDTQRMFSIVHELHKLGFSVSMDDFGSGYSTLNMLKEIMVDVIKIDKDFFSESSNTERGKKIVNSIISMARDLDIQVVAEGVETLEQVQFLQAAGCDLLQGYYYSKPLPSQDFQILLDQL